MLAAPELDSKEHALSYMHRTIENLCIDVFRLESRRPNLVVLDDATAEIESIWQDNGDYSEKIVAAEDAVLIREALSLLSPSERAALVMWELEQRSAEEIARKLRIKKSTVRHTVSRARTSLRRILAERIIDESRGLTALDLLSVSYRKTSKIAKKSSKVALSLALVVFAFLGFNAMPINSGVPNFDNKESVSLREASPSISTPESRVAKTNQAIPAPSATKNLASSENAKSTELWFPGLDKAGIPTGFTVADSTGAWGNAYFTERSSVSSETELIIGQILKTDSGAANIFISQTLITDETGLSYRPIVSFGKAGYWSPLTVRVSSTDVKRQISGDYLLTSYISVESVVETPIKIVASANGRDLASAPRQIITRLVLDASKTKVLAQAVYVVERGVK